MLSQQARRWSKIKTPVFIIRQFIPDPDQPQLQQQEKLQQQQKPQA